MRVVPALDAGTRTLDVTVALTGVPTDAGTPPALVNAYASVRIDGEAPPGAPLYAVPSPTVREAATLWLVAGGALAVVDADVLRVEGGTSYVTLDTVPADALLITSVLPAPVDGMPVAVMSGEGEGADDASAGASDLTLLREAGGEGIGGAGARLR